MFNYTSVMNPKFNTNKVLGGYSNGDFESHKTLYAGVDPTEPKRALIRKVVQVNKYTFCYEETRITPCEGKNPSVHTIFYRIKDFDLNEYLSLEEI